MFFVIQRLINFKPKFRLTILALSVNAIIHPVIADDSIQFNTDVLDVKDREHIDLSQFSRRGYIMPGDYAFKIRVNQNELGEKPISILTSEQDKSTNEIYLTTDIVDMIGFKPEYRNKIKWDQHGKCMDYQSLPGIVPTADLGGGVLSVNIPQAYLEYVSNDWVPPSRWDNGIPGVLFDYNFNAQVQSPDEGDQQRTITGNGTTGANLGSWRFRADWQSSYASAADNSPSQTQWSWNRYYLFRPLSSLGAKLTLGEDYMDSDLFDSIRVPGKSSGLFFASTGQNVLNWTVQARRTASSFTPGAWQAFVNFSLTYF